jgi:hypothetical protein
VHPKKAIYCKLLSNLEQSQKQMNVVVLNSEGPKVEVAIENDLFSNKTCFN